MIPILTITANSTAEAHDAALIALRANGVDVKTDYGGNSIDATMNITIKDPLAEPRIHKAFPGGIEDLAEYVLELEGAKDTWTRYTDDPKDTRWEYTYSQRLRRYGFVKAAVPSPMAQASVAQSSMALASVPIGTDAGAHDADAGAHCAHDAAANEVNQLDYIIKELSRSPITRRAQAVTWMPAIDTNVYDPPCLQSIWFRIVNDTLCVNVRFRSNDAWGASFMNIFGITELIKGNVLEPLRKTYPNLRFGRLNWHADSYHIYQKDLAYADKVMFLRCLEPIESRVMKLCDHIDDYNEAMILAKQKIKESENGY